MAMGMVARASRASAVGPLDLAAATATMMPTAIIIRVAATP